MKDIIELMVASCIPIGLVLLILHRIKTDKGIGVRVIQFICVIMTIPGIMLLALEKILDGQTVAALMGGLLGYLLSGISNFDNKS